MAIKKYLGLNKKLINGGRYGIPSNLIKNAHISDINDLKAYMDLYMKKNDRERWQYIYDYCKVVKTQIGVTKEGIDYAAVTVSDPGIFLPITIFLYETSDNKLNIYRPTRGNLLIDDDEDRGFIPDLSRLNPSQDVITCLRHEPHPMNYDTMLASDYNHIMGHVLNEFFPEYLRELNSDRSKILINKIVVIGPDKIKIDYKGTKYEVVLGMDYMIEDFSHRVVLKSSKSRK